MGIILQIVVDFSLLSGKVYIFKQTTTLLREPIMDIEKFKTYNEEYLTERYEYKKTQCKKRLIPFEFTLQQWLDFHKVLYSGVKCAYINQEFIFAQGHVQFPTVERLFDNLAYSVSNCVWCCHLGNQIKDQLVKGKHVDKFKEGHKNFAKRIEKIIANVSVLETLQEPYKHLFTSPKEETTLPQTTETQTQSPYNYNTTNNSELAVAKLFASFGAFIEQRCDSEFGLTFSQFKTLITRKNCMLTKRPLPESLFERGFWIKDKSVAVTKDNLFVTTKELQTSLDNLSVNANLDIKAIKQLGKVLIK